MKALTPTGRKMLNKICLNCKHLIYKIDDDNCEQIGFCFKKKEIINEYGTCKEFEFELDGDVE